MDETQMQPQISLSEETKRVLAMRTQAVAEAMCEVVHEQQAEIIKRARAKLAALGIVLKDEE